MLISADILHSLIGVLNSGAYRSYDAQTYEIIKYASLKRNLQLLELNASILGSKSGSDNESGFGVKSLWFQMKYEVCSLKSARAFVKSDLVILPRSLFQPPDQLLCSQLIELQDDGAIRLRLPGFGERTVSSCFAQFTI